MAPTTTPVLIVGAGPTGLVLALALARRGVPGSRAPLAASVNHQFARGVLRLGVNLGWSRELLPAKSIDS